MNEQEKEILDLQLHLVQLSRLALHGSRRDVEIYVHRLAYRYRNTPAIAIDLERIDVLPGVSLRELNEEQKQAALFAGL